MSGTAESDCIIYTCQVHLVRFIVSQEQHLARFREEIKDYATIEKMDEKTGEILLKPTVSTQHLSRLATRKRVQRFLDGFASRQERFDHQRLTSLQRKIGAECWSCTYQWYPEHNSVQVTELKEDIKVACQKMEKNDFGSTAAKKTTIRQLATNSTTPKYTSTVQLSIPAADVSVARFIFKSENHTRRLESAMESVCHIQIQHSAAGFRFEMRPKLPKSPGFKSECDNTLKEFLRNYCSEMINCQSASLSQSSENGANLLHKTPDLAIGVGESSVEVVGLKESVEERVHKIRELTRRSDTEFSTSAISPNRGKQTPADGALFSQTCFIFECTPSQRVILNFIVGTRFQDQLAATCKRVGTLTVDDAATKVQVTFTANVHFRVRKNCEACITDFFDKFTSRKKRFGAQLLIGAEKTNAALFSGKDYNSTVSVGCEDDGYVTITGLRSAVDKRMKSIENAVSKPQTKRVSCPLENSKFFINCGIFDELMKKLQRKVKITYDAENEVILYEGLAENIQAAEEELGIYKLKKGKPDIEEVKLAFLKKIFPKHGGSAISNKFIEENIKATIILRQNDPIIVASNVDEFNKGCSLLERIIHLKLVAPSKAVNKCFSTEQSWTDLVETAFQINSVLVLVKNGTIHVTGLNNTDDVFKQIFDFLKDYLSTTLDIDAYASHKARFLATHWEMKSLFHASVSVIAAETKIRITGPKIHVTKTSILVKQNMKQFCEESWSFSIPGILLYTSSNEWKNDVENIEKTYRCGVCEMMTYQARFYYSMVRSENNRQRITILLQLIASNLASHGVPVKGPRVVQPKARLSEPYKYKYGQTTVTVIEGDVTTDDADCILNGCGEDFNLNWGILSRTILHKAGIQMQRECSNACSTLYPLIRVTSGGKLSCKYVIHIVTPRTVDQLGERIADALSLADSMKLTSIALPTLGTGGIGLDVDGVASVMAKVFRQFVAGSSKHVKLIKVVVYESSIVSRFRQIVIDPQVLLSDGTQQLQEAKRRASSLPQTVDFQVCSNSKQQNQKIQIMLKTLLLKVSITKRFNDNIFDEFGDNEWIDIYAAATTQSVSVKVSPSCITLQGLQKNLSNVCDVIKDVTSEFREGKTMKKLCIWKWCLVGDIFIALPLRISRAIEHKHEGKKFSLSLDVFGEKMVIDLKKMTFNYKGFSGVIQRNDNTIAAVQSSSMPVHWDEMLGVSVRKVVLTSTSEEFQRISRLFESSNPPHSSIVTIERVQNPALLVQYLAKKNDVERHVVTKQVERELFHGTSHSDSEKICKHGFDRGFAGKNATAYGHGVYFAARSAYSARYATRNIFATSVMFVAQVLTGDFCVGSSDLKAAPINPNSKDGNRLYDSVVNKLSDPDIFVVFKDSSAYPSYLITYK